MTSKEIDTLIAHLCEVYARREVGSIATFYADNCVVESPSYGRLVGPEAVERAFRQLFATFPDWTVEYHELLNFDGTCVPLLGPQGVFKRVICELPLSITTVPPVEGRPRPYEDEVDRSTGLLRYR